MKSFSVFLLTLACPVLLFSQWYWQRPDPTGVDLNDVCILDEDDGWAVGEGGVILITGSGGSGWQQKYTPTIVNLNSVHIVDPGNVWICGDEGYLFRSSISAITFNTTILNSNESYKCIYFINEQIGWVAGTDGIYNTIDGGLNWTHQYSSNSINTVEFYDENTGYAVGSQNVILRTTNGGIDWIECSCPANFSPNSLSIATQDIIWSVGSGIDPIIRSSDGGQNWEAIPCPTSHQITDIDFADEYFGWIVGQEGIVLKTVNAGSDWTQLTTGDYDDHQAVSFSNVYNGIIVGDEGRVFYSNNGGDSWYRVTQPEHPDEERLSSIQFIEHRGWIGDENSNYIFRTTSGGWGWSKHELDQSSYTLDIFFIDHLKGWAGTDGGIERTNDGGVTWDFKYASSSCHALWFFDHYNGFAGTQSGLLRTTDGGDSFSNVNLNLDGFIYSMFFLNSSNGWLTSSEGEIFHTTNGGESWSLQNTPTGDMLLKVYFLDENYGWACGEGGLLHTTDGGNNWNWQFTASGTIRDVFFRDPDNGYIALGSIFATTDGGDSWIDQYAGSDMGTINAFSFPEYTTGYACGNYSTILRTVNGGFVNTEERFIEDERIVSKIYPNPVKTSFTLEYELIENSIVYIHIFNSIGQISASYTINQDNGKQSFNIDAANYSPGIYFYSITGRTIRTTGKFIKY